MDQLSSKNRPRWVAFSALAIAALFVLVTAWMSPSNVLAATGGSPDNSASDLAPGQQKEAAGETAADPAGATNGVADNLNGAGADVGGAVTGFWGLAWAKAWPPIRDVFMKLWAVTKGVLVALWNVSKDIGDSVNTNINAGVGGAINAPVNAAP